MTDGTCTRVGLLLASVALLSAGIPSAAQANENTAQATDPCSYSVRYECGTSQKANTRSNTWGWARTNHSRDIDSRTVNKDVAIEDNAGHSSWVSGGSNDVYYNFGYAYLYMWCDYNGAAGAKVGCSYNS